MPRTAVKESPRERALRRLADEFEFFAPRALKIVDKQAREVPFTLKPAQIRLARQLEAQRAAGEPMRACVLKARQVGISTQVQGMVIQRAISRSNHKARIVSLDIEGAGALFAMGKRMWEELPGQIKPAAGYARNGAREKLLHFGEASAVARSAGQRGLDSLITIDTQKSAASGRGQTFRSMHLSEVAFWDAWDKVTALLNAVPDDPDTLVVVESTARGLNGFHAFWLACEAGNGFIPFFTPWFEELAYTRPFLNAGERDEFEEMIGKPLSGQIECGEHEEPALIELMREKFEDWRQEGIHPRAELGEAGSAVEWERILMHLNWRRWAIRAKHQSILDDFHEENPSTPEEAFLSTGRSVFDRGAMRRLSGRVRRAAESVPAVEGALVATAHRTVRTRTGTLQIPTAVEWRPLNRLDAAARVRAKWRMWEHPSSGGQYVIGVDPESGDLNIEPGARRKASVRRDNETAAHAIEVINHASRQQAAEWSSDVHDADEMAEQALLAAIYFNQAWLAVEKTGGWGLSTLRWLARDVKYPRTYRTTRKDAGMPREFDDTLGWSTDSVTKPLLIDLAKQLVRENNDGIRSIDLVGEMLTYTMDERGRMNPMPGHRSDRLMAWAIAEMVAQEKPLKRAAKTGSSTSTTGEMWEPREFRPRGERP